MVYVVSMYKKSDRSVEPRQLKSSPLISNMASLRSQQRIRDRARDGATSKQMANSFRISYSQLTISSEALLYAVVQRANYVGVMYTVRCKGCGLLLQREAKRLPQPHPSRRIESLQGLRFHCGRKALVISSFVPTTSLGMRLTR